MASTESKITRRALARQRLDHEVALLADLLGIEMVAPGKPPQDPELAAIVEMERQSDLLAGITAAVVAQFEALAGTTQRVVDGITAAVTGREGLSDEEKSIITLSIAEAVDRALNPPAEGPEAIPEEAGGEPVEGQSRAEIFAATHGDNTFVPVDEDQDDFEVTKLDLSTLTRDQLNAMATDKGILDADKLPNKATVIAAIEAAYAQDAGASEE